MQRTKESSPSLQPTEYTTLPVNLAELHSIYTRTGYGFIMVSRLCVKQFGMIVATVLATYIDKALYFNTQYPGNGGWFFFSHANMITEIHCLEYTLIQAKSKLVSLKILQVKKHGMPAKEWLRVDFQRLMELTSVENMKRPDPKFSGGQDPKFSQGQDPKFSGGLYINTINSINLINNNKIQRKKYIKKEIAIQQNIIPLPQQKVNPDMFELFWKLYPKKISKKTTSRVWNRICNSDTLVTWGTIKKAIINHTQSEQWHDSKYIPHPTTWLNQERWNDTLPTKTKDKPKFYRNENETADPIGRVDGVV